jgi:hypothetical protein
MFFDDVGLYVNSDMENRETLKMGISYPVSYVEFNSNGTLTYVYLEDRKKADGETRALFFPNKWSHIWVEIH